MEENKDKNKNEGEKLSFLDKLKNTDIKDLIGKAKEDEFAGVGVYENPQAKQEQDDVFVPFTPEQIRKKNMAKIFSGLFVFMALVPYLLRTFDPSYMALEKVETNVKTKLICDKEELFREYDKKTNFIGEYIDQKVIYINIQYDFKPVSGMKVDSNIYDKKEYDTLSKVRVMGLQASGSDNSYRVAMDFTKPTLKEDLTVGMYGKMSYIMKNTLENNEFKCREEIITEGDSNGN